MSHREDQRFYRTAFPKFTLSTLPPAADWNGAVVIITDASPPALCWSNGTTWINANNKLAIEAGTGITTGAEQYETSIKQVGGIIKTEILIDIKGLRSTADGDIIGVDGTALFCHIGGIAAESGTLQFGNMLCLQAPTGGDPDINLFKATVESGVEDDAISGITGQGALLDWAGDSTLGLHKPLTALPVAGDYLYLVAGATTDADYTAGRYLIEFWGVPE